MREISIIKKVRVIRSFLDGESYDEIKAREEISKGSVVNIIDDFRENKIPLPPDLTEYIDELRRLVVDLKKNHCTVAKMKTYVRLHTKLEDMGVSSDDVEQWLDICRDIASSAAAESDFIPMLLQFAKVSSETGLNYRALIDDYPSKLDISVKLDKENEQKTERLSNIEEKINEATKELEPIQDAISSAKDRFTRQKTELKLKLDEYMAQNNLSWKRVDIAHAILESALAKSRITKRDKARISRQLASAGSITAVIGKLKSKEKQLKGKNGKLDNKIGRQKKASEKLRFSIQIKECVEENVNKRVSVQQEKLADLEKIISGYVDDIQIAQLIIKFLASSRDMDYKDLDQFVGLMFKLRQKRGIIEYYRSLNIKDKIIYATTAPESHIDIERYYHHVNAASRRLALYLLPLVQDKFTLRFECENTEVGKPLSKLDIEL